MQLVYNAAGARIYKDPLPDREPSPTQQSQVWKYIQQAFPADSPTKILEVNCRTGEDALYLTRLGHKVLAVDGSPNSVEIAKQKAQRSKCPEKPEFRQIGLGGIHADKFGEKFNLIFSNFGGLNSLDKESLERFVDRLPRMLKAKGRVIAVIMPSSCLWENAYSVFSQDEKPRSKKSDKNADNSSYWYHDPSEIKEVFAKHFEVIKIQPIGIAVPPSRIENQLNGKRKFLKRLSRIEKKLTKFSFLAGMADHYLIDLEFKG